MKRKKKFKDRESYKWTRIFWECMRRNRDIQQSAGPDVIFKSFDEFIEQERRDNPGLIGELLVNQIIDDFASVKHDWNKSKLNFEIDLNEVYSMESLKRVVCDIIDTCYTGSVKLNEVTPKKRPKMTDFDIILRIGDMKREGKKDQEIARVIHPRKYADNPESAIRLIAYYNKRYKELIDNKGFLNCGYP